MATPSYWLIKSEPSVYPYAQLVAEGRTAWTGVRNFEARNNLRAMKVGDLALYYHSNEGKEIVAIAKVVGAAYPDPTAPGEDWSAVDVAPERALARPITLAEVKASATLSKMMLVARSRISVVPVTKPEFDAIVRLSATAPKPATAKPKAPAKKAAAKKPAAKKRAARAR